MTPEEEKQMAMRIATQIWEENPGYLEVKVLDDNSIAILQDLMFTRAVQLGASLDCAYTKRFCFEDRALASKHFAELKTEDDELTGYVARRGS